MVEIYARFSEVAISTVMCEPVVILRACRPSGTKLVQDLYVGSKGNRAFLHARLSLGRDQLKPYKTMISN
jgi:hypothetical protein